VTWYTHVNRNVIDANRKHGRNDPPVRFQKGKYGKATYAHEILFPAGGRVVYDHTGTILPCGARLVIVSEGEPIIVPNPNR
jgi:hypothetical protein